MFTKAIVGYDGSERALDALALAESLIGRDGELVACFVRVDPVLSSTERRREPRVAEPLLERAHRLIGGRVPLRCLTLGASSTVTALREEASRERADLIVVGSSHRGPVGRVLAGSTTEGVLHRAPCAVAVAPVGMHRALSGGLTTIAVGIDGGAASRDAATFAAGLAGEMDAKLRLVAVADVTPRMAASPACALVYPAIVEARRVQARETLERLADTLSSEVEIIPEVYEGEPAAALLALSAGVDLLVLESRGRGPVRRLVLGSVCCRLVRRAACPVLVLPASRGPLVRAPEIALSPPSLVCGPT